MALTFRKLRKLDITDPVAKKAKENEMVLAGLLEELRKFKDEQRREKDNTDWVKKLLDEWGKTNPQPDPQPSIPWVPYTPTPNPYVPNVPLPINPYPWTYPDGIWVGDPPPHQQPTITWCSSTTDSTVDLNITSLAAMNPLFLLTTANSHTTTDDYGKKV